MTKETTPVDSPVERAILVGVHLKGSETAWDLADSLVELAELARTAGLEVVGTASQQLDKPRPTHFIGKGKVQEIKDLRHDTPYDMVIFDDELSPSQLRNLERDLDTKILDRTALILDIFAQRARTKEGALQVELAQYEYRLPRLTRAWVHLSRQAGGSATRGGAGVGLRGPGETQLEVDRRQIRSRIAYLKRELEEVRTHRRLHRQRRQRQGAPVVAIVGYTNAGKSTLLNALTNADVLVEDKLFATLDPTTRRVVLPGGQEILLSDTVGFIQKLPPELVASFRATLEEVIEADVILHVVDVTHPKALAQSQTVGQVLHDLGVVDTPMVTALNKIDRLVPDDLAEAAAQAQAVDLYHELQAVSRTTIPISALRGWGLERLMETISDVLLSDMVRLDVVIPFQSGELVSLFHQRGIVDHEEYTEQGTRLLGHMPRQYAPRYRALTS
ncbi:MAG: GTPase HflX [Chloroflexi bacterium]|nr:GTPase HflX [Chloroflexota bacterium]MBU1749362.1 GTPase HflX [Chloroflexota bacterium]